MRQGFECNTVLYGPCFQEHEKSIANLQGSRTVKDRDTKVLGRAESIRTI